MLSVLHSLYCVSVKLYVWGTDILTIGEWSVYESLVCSFLVLSAVPGIVSVSAALLIGDVWLWHVDIVLLFIATY